MQTQFPLPSCSSLTRYNQNQVACSVGHSLFYIDHGAFQFSGGTYVTFIRGCKEREERQTIITHQEFQAMLQKASQIENLFFRLRALALLCLLRLTGKRREEIAMLPLENIKVESGMLTVTFILEKKRKGNILQKQSIKQVPLTDSLTTYITTYLEHLNQLDPKPAFFFPRIKSVFGVAEVIMPTEHISGRQVFNIVRSLSSEVWPHLFRETVGSDVIKQDSSIIGAFKVMRRLDLEDYRTGFNYLKRYAGDVIRREEEKLRTEQAWNKPS